jgi:hypothetical protein
VLLALATRQACRDRARRRRWRPAAPRPAGRSARRPPRGVRGSWAASLAARRRRRTPTPAPLAAAPARVT